MKTRFCTSCQCTREEAGGVYKRGKSTARWICQACLERRSESIYKNQTGRVTSDTHVRYLQKQIGWRSC